MRRVSPVALGLAVAGLLALPANVGAQPSAASPARPNVILILADDFALGDLGPRDGRPSVTPNLDEFARQSVRFQQAYSASCVCAPARAALFTGRYPHRTGVVTLNMETYPELTRLRKDETTIADLMRDAGYVTGLVGKWHVGLGEGYTPLDRGFDEFEGFDGSLIKTYFKYSLTVQDRTEHVEGKYLTDDLSARAIEFVRRHRDQPFFLHLAHYAPHRPLGAPAETIERYEALGFDESTAKIYAMIEIMDRGLGKLFRELDDLDLADNTIVIFTSDNGPDPLTGERYNRDLRGTKYQIYEGGIRVPLFVRWTGHFEPGDRQPLVHFVDLLPTILELCSIEPALPNPLDGQSAARLLHDPAAEFAPVRYWQWNRGEPNYTNNAAIRAGDFKLVRPYITRNIDVVDSTLPPVLYHLEQDPTEQTDVSAAWPDLTRRLNDELQQWTDDVERDRVRPLGANPGR